MIAIYWLDIVSDAIGDIAKADTAYCVTLGHFHEWKGRGRNRMLVTGLTIFPQEEGEEPRGWDTYPVGCIDDIKVVVPRD